MTIRIPFEKWKGLKEPHTMGKNSSIQQTAVTGMDNLIKSLRRAKGRNPTAPWPPLGVYAQELR